MPRMMARPMKITNGQGISVPGTYPKPSVVNSGGKLLMPCGPRTMSARPRNSASVPRVTTREGRPPRATSRPFIRPPSTPTNSTIATPIQIGTPAAHRNPRTALERPAIDSTERSISPAMMTSVIGRAMIATSIMAASRFAKLLGVRKTGEIRVPNAIIASSTTSSSVSQRTSERSLIGRGSW